ncbi:TPA: DUF3265 domain-containing protein [Vibrio vulnificus]|nr:DUF3265 domain-containing protein [Vibrio vulnificus]
MQQRTSPNVWAYNKHNKRFKTDSQRVAFLPCVDFSDLGGVRKHRYCVAHHLSGRYALIGKMTGVNNESA